MEKTMDVRLKDHVARRDSALNRVSNNLRRLTKEEIVAAMACWLSTECLEDLARHTNPEIK